METAQVVTQSAGRINIIGEHIDYNDGFVLPAAVDKKTIFKLKKNTTKHEATIIAGNIGEAFTFNLTDFHPLKNGWQNYVMGVVHELQQIGAKLSGFDGEFSGDVPIGGGMSSSAALECSLAYGLNELFQLGFDKWQLIKACQNAEHNFVGIKCGIMDQFASMMGQKNQAMLLDCRSLDFQYIPINLGDYQFVLLNTNISHSLASSEYNNRRAECEQSVSIANQTFPNIESLRDLSFDQYLKIADKMPGKIANRCRHVILENERVLQAAKALNQANFKRLGQLMYNSHFSLQNDYEVSCPQLDYLVRGTLDKDYILGSRMMGGGFGGCTLSLVEKKWATIYIDLASRNYYNHFGIDLTPYTVAIENGTTLIN